MAADEAGAADDEEALARRMRRGRRHLVDSHLVAARLSAGWLTSRCQTTAHSPSVCGRDPIGRDGRDDHAGLGARPWSRRRPCRRCRRRPRRRSRASSSARTRFSETFFSRLPPPTENTSTRVARAEARDLEPLGEAGVPALVVHARGQLGDVVGRRVGLEAADLAEVVDGVAGVAGRAADAQDEQAPAGVAHARRARSPRASIGGGVELAHRASASPRRYARTNVRGAHSLYPAACGVAVEHLHRLEAEVGRGPCRRAPAS